MTDSRDLRLRALNAIDSAYPNSNLRENIPLLSNMKRFIWISGLLVSIKMLRADGLYVSNWGGGNGKDVYIFSLDGSQLGAPLASPNLQGVTGIDHDAEGNLYVASLFSHNIVKFSPSGVAQEIVANTGQTDSPWPDGLHLDSQGNLFVANQFEHAVEIFSPSGAHLKTFAQLSGPILDVAFDHDGNVFVSAIGTGVARFAPDGSSLGPAIPMEEPGGLAFDAAGNLYASNVGSGFDGTFIEKFDPAGNPLGQYSSTGLSGPLGMVFDDAGNLYVANFNKGSEGFVSKIPPRGGPAVELIDMRGIGAPTFLSIAQVPEPSRFLIFTLGAVSLYSLHIRRKQRT
jgi:DNA-binding beta-propeller fold protein YncE